MMHELAPLLMITAIALMITIIIISLIKYRLKKRMVESGMMEESVIKLMLQPKGPKAEARAGLKWALIMFFGGLGLLVNEFLPFEIATSAVPLAVEVISVSIAFFILYRAISKLAIIAR